MPSCGICATAVSIASEHVPKVLRGGGNSQRPVKRIGGADDQSQTARRPNGLEHPTLPVRPELPGLPTGSLSPQRRAKLERRLSVVPATS
ncbi:unnamed protein product [Fusarium graminearum]|uniref:Uncharacterized protein n=1 Tax=Gibberella zeae TaxID=5518 RepID=A0A4E9EI13_GIBZA